MRGGSDLYPVIIMLLLLNIDIISLFDVVMSLSLLFRYFHSQVLITSRRSVKN